MQFLIICGPNISSIGHKIIFNPCMIENIKQYFENISQKCYKYDLKLQGNICKKHVFCTIFDVLLASTWQNHISCNLRPFYCVNVDHISEKKLCVFDPKLPCSFSDGVHFGSRRHGPELLTWVQLLQ